eukprot:CAMPEP_0198138688 /NCGR_PEP_ID=MMETSP1443-20131203/2087_1 /TAXON_ID=186043 /ORGANISM="Entomoneis sp., Strain CCMP2396" /LENGTH=54 /DNA_ID=CAMNT_0043800573 /DNA_START=28 /DNA_END=192 /DNA_ORIENTATION=-
MNPLDVDLRLCPDLKRLRDAYNMKQAIKNSREQNKGQRGLESLWKGSLQKVRAV